MKGNIWVAHAGTIAVLPRFPTIPHDFVIQEDTMADGSGATGILGVLVGAILVIFVGAAVLIGTGHLGGKGGGTSKTFTIKLPDAK